MTEIYEKMLDEEWQYLSPIIDQIDQNDDKNFPYIYLNQICLHPPLVSYVFVECILLITTNFLIDMDDSNSWSVFLLSELTQDYVQNLLISIL